MLLENKTAIIYGAAGAIGAAAARAYAREGATVYLTGRTASSLEHLADDIRGRGGDARSTVLDALDSDALNIHAAMVASLAGGIDIAFNATSNDDLQGRPLLDMDLADVLRPVDKVVTTQVLIATAVAPHMVSRRRGVILAMGGGREAIPNLGGSHIAWSALAGVCRQLASELGPYGIRVSWLLSPGSPEPALEGTGAGAGSPDEIDEDAGGTLLKRRPTLDDVANAATFLASDWARTMTATELNLTGGVVVD